MTLRLPLKTLRNRLRHAVILLLLSPCVLAATGFQNLYSFTGGNDGGSPLAGLVADGSGNLYGTTAGGGTDRCGTIFELSHANGAWSERILYSFTCGNDGFYPNANRGRGGAIPTAGLAWDHAGNLYGTTSSGSRSVRGSVFQLQPDGHGSWKEKVLHRFAGGSDGDTPMAALTFDSAGNIYGTTEYGGGLPPCGVVVPSSS